MSVPLEKRIEELESRLAGYEALVPRAYNEGIREGMREMNSFHGAKDWEETVSYKKLRALLEGEG